MTEVQKKETGKVTLIAVAVVAVVLAISNVWVYMSLTDVTSEKNTLQGQVNALSTDKANLQSQLSSLNTTYQNYESGHLHANSQYDALNAAYQNYTATHSYNNSAYNALKDDRDYYYDVANLNWYHVYNDRATVYHAAGYYYSWYDFTGVVTEYAGYLVVQVYTSTVASTYIRVIYSAYGVNFDWTFNVGGAGTATFPILPSDNLEVRVGNNYGVAAQYDVSITFYY
jgi:hypothetical protein